MTVGFTIQFNHVLHTESTKQLRYDNSANRIDSVYSHSETGSFYGFRINQIESQDTIDMPTVIGIVYIFSTEIIYTGKNIFFSLGNSTSLPSASFRNSPR